MEHFDFTPWRFLNPNLERLNVFPLESMSMHGSLDYLLSYGQAKRNKTGMLFIQIDTQC